MATHVRTRPSPHADSPLDSLARQASLGHTFQGTRPPPISLSQSAPSTRSYHHNHFYDHQSSAMAQFATQFRFKPEAIDSPLLHTKFRTSTATALDMTDDEPHTPSWNNAGEYYIAEQDQEVQEDPYGGMENDASEGSRYSTSPFPSPLLSTHSNSGLTNGGHTSADTSSTPLVPQVSTPSRSRSQSRLESNVKRTPPLSPLHPPQPLRYLELRGPYRSSGSSSDSTASKQLTVDMADPDQRSTWRSDITASTNADAFAFRDYESPAPPKVVITAPLTPRRSLEDIGQREWQQEKEAKGEYPTTFASSVGSPRVAAEPPRIQPSPSGRSLALVSAYNFSRPIRASASPSSEPSLYSVERPDSVASSYSTASSTSSRPASRATNPTSDHSHGFIGPDRLQQQDKTLVPQSILRSSVASADLSPAIPLPPSNESVSRRPSIRFQDPRPAPPIPSQHSSAFPTYINPPVSTLARSLSSPHRPTLPPNSFTPPTMQRSTTFASSRAQIMDAARSRPPPLPPTADYRSPSTTPRLGFNSPHFPPSSSRSYSRAPSPGDSLYSNTYSYYDPELANGSPVPGPSSPRPSHAPPPSAGPRPKARAREEASAIAEANPQTAEDYLQLGISHHLKNNLVKSAYCFEISAKGVGALRAAASTSSRGTGSEENRAGVAPEGCGVGMLMWGLALRSGWGVAKDEKKGFKWLRKAAEHAVEDLEMGKVGHNVGAVQNELVLAIYEVGQCFFHGWGVKGDKKMAVSYYQAAAKLGDPDAQQELAFCLVNGKGCKQDKREAAKWYRAAAGQGASTVGLAWIYKDKYM